MNTLWWQSWSVEALSPLNPLAVVAAQLSPPDWETLYLHRQTEFQWAQLWWLCWYARPDLREQMLRGADFPHYSLLLPVVIHPETIAEWAKLPQWVDTWSRQQEWSIRNAILCSIPLTVEQCRNLHPDLWDAVSVAFQAGQSVAHGKQLLPQIQALSEPAAHYCLHIYSTRHGIKRGACWKYLKAFMDWE